MFNLPPPPFTMLRISYSAKNMVWYRCNNIVLGGKGGTNTKSQKFLHLIVGLESFPSGRSASKITLLHFCLSCASCALSPSSFILPLSQYLQHLFQLLSFTLFKCSYVVLFPLTGLPIRRLDFPLHSNRSNTSCYGCLPDFFIVYLVH